MEKVQLELSELTGSENDSVSLEKSVKNAQVELLEASQELNKARHQIAKEIEKDIKHELSELYMEKADFKVSFDSAKFSANGNEHVEFFIQTNPGEGFKPLAKTASGGELSRLMLAIKSSFSRRENKTAIVLMKLIQEFLGVWLKQLPIKYIKLPVMDKFLRFLISPK